MLQQRQTQRRSRPRILLPSELCMACWCLLCSSAGKEGEAGVRLRQFRWQLLLVLLLECLSSFSEASWSYRTCHCFARGVVEPATPEQGSQGDEQQQQQFMKLGAVMSSQEPCILWRVQGLRLASGRWTGFHFRTRWQSVWAHRDMPNLRHRVHKNEKWSAHIDDVSRRSKTKPMWKDCASACGRTRRVESLQVHRRTPLCGAKARDSFCCLRPSGGSFESSTRVRSRPERSQDRSLLKGVSLTKSCDAPSRQNIVYGKFTILLWLRVSSRLRFWYGFEYGFVIVCNSFECGYGFCHVEKHGSESSTSGNHTKNIADTCQNQSWGRLETYRNRIKIPSESYPSCIQNVSKSCSS